MRKLNLCDAQGVVVAEDVTPDSLSAAGYEVSDLTRKLMLVSMLTNNVFPAFTGGNPLNLFIVPAEPVASMPEWAELEFLATPSMWTNQRCPLVLKKTAAILDWETCWLSWDGEHVFRHEGNMFNPGAAEMSPIQVHNEDVVAMNRAGWRVD